MSRHHAREQTFRYLNNCNIPQCAHLLVASSLQWEIVDVLGFCYTLYTCIDGILIEAKHTFISMIVKH